MTHYSQERREEAAMCVIFWKFLQNSILKLIFDISWTCIRFLSSIQTWGRRSSVWVLE